MATQQRATPVEVTNITFGTLVGAMVVNDLILLGFWLFVQFMFGKH